MSDLDLNGGLFRPKHKAIPFNTELSTQEQTEIADTSLFVRQEKAKALLRKNVGVDAVMNATSLPRREVHRLMGEVRNEQPPPSKGKPQGRNETAPDQTPDTQQKNTQSSVAAYRNLPPLVHMTKAPRVFGLPRTTLYRLAAEDRVTLRKVGRSSYVETASVLKLIGELPKASIGPGSAK
jgi:hypothetical protein